MRIALQNAMAVLDELQPEVRPPEEPARRALTESEFCKLRGANSFNAHTAAATREELQSLRDIGATLARVWMVPQPLGDSYFMPEEQLARMDDALRLANEIGLRLVVCLAPHPHWPWGNAEKSASYVALIVSLVARWRGPEFAALAAIDMANEPYPLTPPIGGAFSPEQFAQVARDWRALAAEIVAACAAADASRLLVYEVGLGGDPNQAVMALPLEGACVVHSVHFYLPHSFTHQKEADRVTFASARAVAVAALDALAAWSARHRRPWFLGETSAARFALGAPDYIELILQRANAENWGWCYHEWRRYHDWDAETMQVDGKWLRNPQAPVLLVLKRALLAISAAALAGCETLANYGIGGPPALMCRKGKAEIDDRLVGPDNARLSIIRRFADADPLCKGAPNGNATRPNDTPL